MSKTPCPYKALPDESYWRRGVSVKEASLIDPMVNPKFKIGKTDKIATAGSCFAQHISRYMRQSGYNYFVTEKGHPVLPPEIALKHNYTVFSARYGNIYTTRQLLQTAKRAYGLFESVDDVWEEGDTFIDPFRPYIQPGGFTSKLEYDRDRKAHYSAIREMIENFDVFVFTLGLTEMWYNTEDGTAYAVCPGCGAGDHNPEKHNFHNLTVQEVVDDLNEFIAFCKKHNPTGKYLLTVSPVPLIATFEEKHVITSTVYSKSVLRVAAQMVSDTHDDVDYFPSYEIITGNFSRGAYYEKDLREVSEYGVNHAMSCFFRHYLNEEVERQISPILQGQTKNEPSSTSQKTQAQPDVNDTSEMTIAQKLSNVICDEEEFERRLS